MNTIKKAICSGMIGLAGLVANGCTTAADAYGQALFENVIIPTAASAVVDEGIRTSIAGPRGTTVNVNNQGSQQSYQIQQQLPENVIYQEGKGYNPAPGYEWVNAVNGDLRVRPVAKFAKVFTCNSWQNFNISGLKNEFSRAEPITMVREVKGYRGYLETRITGPVIEGVNNKPETTVTRTLIDVDGVQTGKIKADEAGKYLIDCFISNGNNEEYLDSCEFYVK